MYYGIDIGGTKIELAAYNEMLQPCWSKRVATPTDDYALFLQVVTGLVQEADAALGCRGAVGLGLPGVIDPDSGGQLSANVPALGGKPVRQQLAALLARPVVQGNDCVCFAVSEANGGAAEGYPTMFGAILGTGAGGGFCINGQPLYGYSGVAGEWGHRALPAALQARYQLPLYECGCGLSGCLERYVSGGGLSNIYQAFSQISRDARTIFNRAQDHDVHAVAAVACHLDILAYGLAGLILHYDPHTIVLGGGLSQEPSLYRDLPQAIARHLFSAARVPPILPPRFGDAAGTRGAAILARQALPF